MTKRKRQPAESDKRPRGFSIVAKAGKAEVYIYEEIDPFWGLGAKRFRDELAAAGDVSEIHVRINSPGGSVFEGLGIYNTLRNHPAEVTVHIDGMALSMASVVAMAGDVIEAADNAFLMIHNPMNLVMGDAEELRDMAELLDKIKAQLVGIYAERSGQSAERIGQLMDAETWLTAAEALDLGFVDRTSGALAVAASFDASRFPNIPAAARELIVSQHQGHTEENPMSETNTPAAPAPAPTDAPQQAAPTPAAPQPASYHELKAGCPGADDAFLCSQLAANATVEAARSAWMAEQTKRLEAARAQAKKPGQDVAPEGSPGAKPAATFDDPVAEFDRRVRELVAAGQDRRAAAVSVARRDPDLHREFLVATNPGAKARQLIEDRFA